MGKRKKVLRTEDEKVSKPNKKQKKEKPSKKEKIKSMLVPRLRLEPRLTATTVKIEDNINQITDIEKNKRLVVSLNASEVLQENLTDIKPHATLRSNNEQSQTFFAVNGDQSLSQGNETEQTSDCESIVIKTPRKRLAAPKIYHWSDRELKNLAIGLQTQGFADMQKVATDFVKTKNENDINHYMRPRTQDMRNKACSKTERSCGRPANKFCTVSPENLQNWPNVRKWRRLAYEQMLPYTRSKDYSRPAILALCKQFYEEEEEPADPQVINVKAIYKYIMDCMAGEVPAQLPPNESLLVLDMIREVKLIALTYDFEEERKFVQEFRNATTFKPFEIKDEFKKKYKKENEVSAPNTVSVPEEVFLDLSRHKKLVQSFNPLITPVWMLQKEQEHLEKYSKESNVYVD